MADVYQECPRFENDNYCLRMVCLEDCPDLLKVYSDKKAVPFFNSDNCNGDDFYYTSEARMREAIEYWLYEYRRKGFVRWAVLSKETNEAIGTIELFHRDAEDYFTNCGLLRLDLRSDYEEAVQIKDILGLLVECAYTYFTCDKLATKAVPEAAERIKALEGLGFMHTDEALIGHDGTAYGSYYVLPQMRNKAISCVKDTALPVQMQWFQDCDCDLDKYCEKYGETKYFFARIIEKGHIYEMGYPKCVCPEALSGKKDASFCECSRQSMIYVLENMMPGRRIKVETVETVLSGASKCRFQVVVE